MIRLKTGLRVAALRRTAEGLGLFAIVLDKGHEEAGIIHVLWRDGDASRLYTEQTSEDGLDFVLCAEDKGMGKLIDERLASERAFDPDLWTLEITGPFDVTSAVLGTATV